MRKGDHTRIVLRCAIASRILLLTLIIIWRSFFSPYDTSASINPSCLSLSSESHSQPAVRFPWIASAIEESIVWDSVFFVRIAQCGYEYEQTYAFLPLLPMVIAFLSNTVFWPLVPLIGYRAVLGFSGYAINSVAFMFAALYLYRLSVLILKDPKASLRASILFCFNPASIFYSSIYSESLYALFSIGGLYYLMSGANNYPVLWLAISGSARANGALNAGYYAFKALHESYYTMYVKKRASLALQVLFSAALRCICIFIPFLAFQLYGYYNLCHGRSPDLMRPWCKGRVPLLYSFIQSHYWGVGFLRYFQLKQLPNFLLACPVLSLAFWAIHSYLKNEFEKFFSLGFGATLKEKNSEAALLFYGGEEQFKDVHYTESSENTNLRQRQYVKTHDRCVSSAETTAPVKSGYYSVVMLPFIYHLGFMAATAFLVMHVQVATRFLSASPPLYWFASQVMAYPGKSRRWGYLIWGYAASYILLGSLLFSNFYPFT